MRRTGNRQGARLTPRGRQAAPAPEPRGEAAGPSGGRKGGLRSGICRQAVRPTGTAWRRDAAGAADRTAPDWAGPPVGPGPTYEGTAARDPPGNRIAGVGDHAGDSGASCRIGVRQGRRRRGGSERNRAVRPGRRCRRGWHQRADRLAGKPGSEQAADRGDGGRLASRTAARGGCLRGAPAAVRGAARGPGRRPEAFAQATATT